MGPFLAGQVGYSQYGGRCDPRFLILARWDGRARRWRMGLPTLDIYADARFGFDGGRHGHFIQTASNSSARPREVVLLALILKSHKLRVRDCDKNGIRALLPAVRSGGGGTVQGLAPSTVLYGSVPSNLVTLSLCVAPPSCTQVDPMFLRPFMSHYTANMDPSQHVDPNAVQNSCVDY